MTRFSRVLTIVVTVLAVMFMGVAMVTTATSANWRDIATKQFPKTEIQKQQQQLQELEEKIKQVDGAQQLAVATIEADVKVLTDPATGREVTLEKTVMAPLEEQTRKVAQEAEVQARKADARLDELKLRRDDIVRLRGQHDELESQRQASQAEVKRLEDLLFQAKAMLDRVERRRAWLESETKSADAENKP